MTGRPYVMIIDDDESIAYAFRALFERDGYEVGAAADGAAGLASIDARAPDLIFLDISMPGMNGLDVLAAVKERRVPAPVIVITGFGTMATAIRAMQLGAYEYVTKPLDVERVRLIAGRALETATLRAELSALRSELRAGRHDRELVGSDLRMQELFKQIGVVTTTPNPTTVLLRGESGTGKELVARAIHVNGQRAASPFIAINCAVLPEPLLENELFGHERGAFTGAAEMRKGKFELAGDGTIFLDEIGELTPALQQKFLRVVQEREFERLGGHTQVPVNARFIAATNRNLEDDVRSGRFREDLYFRLNVITITLPPLRERRDDIPLLAETFIRRANATLGKSVRGIAEDAMQMLADYDFPGNVRELENLIERAMVMTKTDVLTADLFPADLLPATPAPDIDLPLTSPLLREARATILAAFERKFVIERLRQSHGNVTTAAHDAGVERQYFQRLMKRHGIASEDFRGEGMGRSEER
jgi:DNA-binding NtrC family response regulator